MSEYEKLKKARLERKKGKGPYSHPSSVSSMSSQNPPPPPPQLPKRESFARRFKFLWPLLLTVNLSVGAYLFMRTKKKDTTIEDEAASNAPASVASTAATKITPAAEIPLPSALVREPIPENQQRELFSWLLEEKRKIKPKDREEKKCIDEEKAILKKFIRAKSIPSF